MQLVSVMIVGFSVQHLLVMEDMLKDFLLGEHLLLVGNQGVGKNKIVDRFLFLLNRPREYLQLHRYCSISSSHSRSCSNSCTCSLQLHKCCVML